MCMLCHVGATLAQWVEQTSIDQKFGGPMPGSSGLHVEVYLGCWCVNACVRVPNKQGGTL